MAPYPSTANAIKSTQSRRSTQYELEHQKIASTATYTLLGLARRALSGLSGRYSEVPFRRSRLNRLKRCRLSDSRRGAMRLSRTTVRSGDFAATDRQPDQIALLGFYVCPHQMYQLLAIAS